MSALESGKFASELELTEVEYEVFKNFRLITAKPMMFVCNVKVVLVFVHSNGNRKQRLEETSTQLQWNLMPKPWEYPYWSYLPK